MRPKMLNMCVYLILSTTGCVVGGGYSFGGGGRHSDVSKSNVGGSYGYWNYQPRVFSQPLVLPPINVQLNPYMYGTGMYNYDGYGTDLYNPGGYGNGYGSGLYNLGGYGAGMYNIGGYGNGLYNLGGYGTGLYNPGINYYGNYGNGYGGGFLGSIFTILLLVTVLPTIVAAFMASTRNLTG